MSLGYLSTRVLIISRGVFIAIHLYKLFINTDYGFVFSYHNRSWFRLLTTIVEVNLPPSYDLFHARIFHIVPPKLKYIQITKITIQNTILMYIHWRSDSVAILFFFSTLSHLFIMSYFLYAGLRLVMQKDISHIRVGVPNNSSV